MKANIASVIKLVASLLLILLAVFANEQAHAAGGEGIPTTMITLQVINVTLTILLIYFAAGKMIKSHFAQKHEDFHAELKKAETAQRQAEDKHRVIKERLKKLETSAGDSLEKAKAEAEELKHKLIADAQTLANKLLSEAEKSSAFEVEKAKMQIREELIRQSLLAAREELDAKVDDIADARLKNEFVNKIQAVQ